MKKTLIHIVFILLLSWQAFGQNQTDSLKNLLANAKGEQRIEVLHNLIFENWLNQPDSALLYAEEALTLAKNSQDQVDISKSLRLLGGTYNYKGEFETALDYNIQSLEIASQISDSFLIHNALNNIGFVYIGLGNYHNALEYLMLSYEVKQNLGITYGLEHTLNNIGLVYSQAHMFDSAHHYLQKGLSVAKTNKNKQLMLYSNNNIGDAYLKQYDFQNAKESFDASLRIAKQIENKNWEAAAFQGMGQVMLYKQAFDSALFYFNRSLSTRSLIKDQKGMGEIYLWLAKLSFMQDNPNGALRLLDTADSIANKINAQDLVIKINEITALVYKNMGDQEKANELLLRTGRLKDSLYVNVLGRNLSLIQLKLKENKNRLLLQKSELALNEKTFQNMVYISIILLIIPFSILLILNYQRNKKINSTLKKQNDKVEAQKEEIETQKEYLEFNLKELEKAKNVITDQKNELEILNEQLAGTVDKRNIELQSVNDRLRTTSLELDNFIYKSSHDIKGPIVRLMGICDLALRDVEDAKALSYFSMLDKAALRLNIIIEELKLISELNDKALENTRIDFKTLAEESFNEVAYIENIKYFDLNTDVDHNLIFYSDASLVQLIIFNLLQNSVQLMKSEDILNYKIQFAVSHQSRSIKMSFRLFNLKLIDEESNKLRNGFTKAQKEYETISIGLYTVKQCIKKLNGYLDVKSEDQRNTVFEVELPKQL